MSQREKLRQRFLSAPKDFTWAELVRFLGHQGYKELDNRGTSHRSFVNDTTGEIVSATKPHGGKDAVKVVYLKEIKDKLKLEG